MENTIIIKMTPVDVTRCGFFSCCSMALYNLMDYINKTKILPDIIDRSDYFVMYKDDPSRDITYDYFKKESDVDEKMIKYPVCFYFDLQYNDYKRMNTENLQPILKKFFTPNDKVMKIKKTLIEKYSIDPDNTIACYFRGTDKFHEVHDLGKVEDYVKITNKIISDGKKMKILLLSDSQKFIDEFLNLSNHTSIIISENKTSKNSCAIHKGNTKKQNHEEIYLLFATYLIIADCKHFVCNSCNGSLWTMLYRNNSDNIYQYSKSKWLFPETFEL